MFLGPRTMATLVAASHSRGALGQEQQKHKHNFKWLFPLLVLSQCDLCSSAWRFCVTWSASCKGPIDPGSEEKITQPLCQGPLLSLRKRNNPENWGWIALPQELITGSEQLTFTSQCFHGLVYFYASLYRTFSRANGSSATSVRLEIRGL